MSNTSFQTQPTSKRKHINTDIENGIEYEAVITIMAPAEKIYSFWRDFTNLPRFMKHLSGIQVRTSTLSHWQWKALFDQLEIEWDSEIVRDVPGVLIAWRSVEGSTVAHTGEVSFQELPHDRGTEVRLIVNYHPPGGVVTDFIGKFLGESPYRSLQDDLRRLRMVMEAGIVPTVEGQPRGGMEETLNPAFYSHH